MTIRMPISLRKVVPVILDIIGIVVAFTALFFDLIRDQFSAPKPGVFQITLVGAGLILTIISSVITPTKPIKHAIQFEKSVSFIIFTVSILLITINLIGFLIPLRNPAIYEGINYGGKVREAQYTPDEVYNQMNRIESIDEQYPEYVIRLTQLIYDGTVHYWKTDPDNAFNLRIPIHENFLIYLLTKFQMEDQLYEFCQAERAIERGASVCSQSAKILADILIRNRIRAHIIGLEGHVVVRARVVKEPEQWWVLDADYGVVIKEDIDEIENNPEIIRSAYGNQGYRDGVIDQLVNIYGPEGNQVIDERLRCDKEIQLYLLKWLTPLVGMLPFLLYLVVKRVRNA